MKKFTITVIVGITLLAAASAAQAHSRYHSDFRGSVSVAIPVGHHGYAVLGAGPYFYGPAFYRPIPYARYNYLPGYDYRHRHVHKHKHRHDKRHDYYRHDYYRGDHHRRGRR